MQQYDYSKLTGRIKECGYTQESLSKILGISETTLNFSLNNKRNFKQDEMLKMCEVLHISKNRITEYFFTHNLKKSKDSFALPHPTSEQAG